MSPISPVALGLLGSAPPVCFAIFGVLTPLLARRLGLERLLVVAIVVLSVSLVLRGAASNAATLLAATVAIFAGVAVGNVVLPPLVKKYFPDRIGLVTTMYMTAMAVSTFLPPLVAMPVADAVGWRWALAQWGVRRGRGRDPLGGAAAARAGGPRRRGARARERAGGQAAVGLADGVGDRGAVHDVEHHRVHDVRVGADDARRGRRRARARRPARCCRCSRSSGLPLSLFVPLLTARLGIVKTIVGVATSGLALGYRRPDLRPGARAVAVDPAHRPEPGAVPAGSGAGQSADAVARGVGLAQRFRAGRGLRDRRGLPDRDRRPGAG